MRAREWTIAGTFGAPEDYGIPELPDWDVVESACGGIAYADDGDAYISAENPVRVRR